MRLTSYEIDSILECFRNHFGKDTRIFLFGSRTLDTARGGDIDLFIDTSVSGNIDIRTKNAFITDLIMKIGERRIDVVLGSSKSQANEFIKTIMKNAIELC